jgi:hypothetical protein
MYGEKNMIILLSLENEVKRTGIMTDVEGRVG